MICLFLEQADDATFESELPDFLDVESFAAYLAVNNLLVNTDSIAGMNNNYYLYYDETVERFTLLERFMANATFKSLAEDKFVEIYQKAFVGGALVEDVERFSSLIHSVNDERSLVDLDAYDQAVQKVLDFISQRQTYLENTTLLSQ
jgi:spore coat protein CotH